MSEIETILKTSKTIAVLGAHSDPSKPAYYVPEYLQGQGYQIFPVNAAKAGQTILGQEVLANLADLTTAIDIVDVFRRSETLTEHLEDLLAMKPLPKVVWFQLGIQHDEVAEKLRQAGIVVVQNRCTLAEHRRLTK